MKKAILYTAAALMLMLSACGSDINTAESETEAPKKEYIVEFNDDTIVTGTSLMGESLDGKTYAEACRIVNEAVDKMKNAEVVIRCGGQQNISVTMEDISVGIIDEADADSIIQTNTLENTSSDISLVTSLDQDTVQSTIQRIADVMWKGTPAKNASYGVEDGQVVLLADSETGVAYDTSSGTAALCSQLLSGEVQETYYVDAVENILEPELKEDKLGVFSVIGTFTTEFLVTDEEDSRNRLKNLTSSTAHMNGTVVAPGEQATALTMYGDITEENGYAAAGTINNGTHIDELGGGICQTTTTLYNALLYAEVNVVYRHNHSLLSNYVPASREAMVYAQGNSDFIFENSTSDYLVINSYVTTDQETGKGTLTVNLIGLEEHAPDHTVEYETEILSIEVPEVNNVVDDSRPIGWQNMQDKVYMEDTSNGYSPAVTSRLWKITTDNGVETRTLFTDTDVYQSSVGPDVYVSPDVRVIASPSVGEEDYHNIYMKLNTCFIDYETPMTVDYIAWSDEERTAFNEKMTQLLAEQGYVWPYSGASYEQ